MTGYCEVCQREAEADDEEATPICAKCGHDLIQGVHVDDQFYDEALEEGWLCGYEED